MKKIICTITMLSLLTCGLFNTEKANAAVFTAVGANPMVSGILIAAGLTFGATGVTIATLSRNSSPSNRGHRIAGIVLGSLGVLVGAALILLPAEGNSMEITELDLNDLPSGLTVEEAEIFNNWSIPLTLQSRSVAEKLNEILEQNANSNRYNTDEKKSNLAAKLWENKFRELEINRSDIAIINKVFKLQNN